MHRYDIFELLAAIDLAHALGGDQLIAVRQARASAKVVFVEAGALDDQRVASQCPAECPFQKGRMDSFSRLSSGFTMEMPRIIKFCS
jgi:hypothetical protein